MMLIGLGLVAWLSVVLVGGEGHNGGLIVLELSLARWLGLVLWLACAMGLGLMVSASGNAMAGGALLAAGLLIMAARGGSIQWWIRLHAEPGMYMSLAIEAAIWCLPFVGLILLTRWARRGVRRHLPAMLRLPHYSEIAEEEQSPPVQLAMVGLPVGASVAGVIFFQGALWVDYTATLVIGMGLLLVVWLLSMWGQSVLDRDKVRLAWRAPMASAFVGSIGALASSSAVGVILLRSVDSGQVIGALLVAGVVGGLVGHTMFPTPSRLTYILTPLVMAIASYLWVGLSVADGQELLSKLFVANPGGGLTPLFPLALALPSQYASAGVLGTLLGVGWSQAIHAAHQRHVTLITT